VCGETVLFKPIDKVNTWNRKKNFLSFRPGRKLTRTLTQPKSLEVIKVKFTKDTFSRNDIHYEKWNTTIASKLRPRGISWYRRKNWITWRWIVCGLLYTKCLSDYSILQPEDQKKSEFTDLYDWRLDFLENKPPRILQNVVKVLNKEQKFVRLSHQGNLWSPPTNHSIYHNFHSLFILRKKFKDVLTRKCSTGHVEMMCGAIRGLAGGNKKGDFSFLCYG
jgi:hypothetical protein